MSNKKSGWHLPWNHKQPLESARQYQRVPTSEHPTPPPERKADCQIRASSFSEKTRKQATTVLEMLLLLSDEDICWIVSHAVSDRPSLESSLEGYRERLQRETESKMHPAEWEMKRVDTLNGKDAAQLNGKENSSQPTFSGHLYDMPVLQFMAPRFFASEGSSCVEVQVQRIGRISSPSEVRFATRDATAVGGKHYRATEGSLVFEVGETFKTISVALMDDTQWLPNREFFIELMSEDLVNAKLEKYLSKAKVLVLEDDPFPSGKYKELIWEGKIDDVPTLGLVSEYVKMQWRNSKIRCSTIKIILSDMLDNLHFLAKALLQMYLVDLVLDVEVPESSLFLMHDRNKTLIYVAVLILLPQFLIHYLELSKPFGVGSESRKVLQKSLFDRFLNYSPTADVAQGDILMAMSRDSLAIVDIIYRGLLRVIGLLGKLTMICITQFAAPLIFDQPIHWVTIIPLFLLPLLMIVFLAARDRMSTAVLFERLKLHDALIEFVSETAQNQEFIRDCSAHSVFLDLCESKIDTYHYARKTAKHVVVNNRQFAEWLSNLLLAFYTLIGGWAVINGSSRLGLYVTNFQMFQGLGTVYSDLYVFVLSIHEVTPGLKRLTRLLNVPTQLAMQKSHYRHHFEQLNKLSVMAASQDQEDIPFIDKFPICFGGVTFGYEVSLHSDCFLSVFESNKGGVNFNGDMRMSQGELVQLIGPHGQGKTTLLKLIGGILLPNFSDELMHSHRTFFFVPPHLTSIYIPSEPTFFRGSLYDNLTVCVKPGNSDGSMARVGKVCQCFGVFDVISGYLEDNSAIDWVHHLSHTQRALLSLSRALIANPELLCIERHWMGFDDQTSMNIVQLLRVHVDNRGIEQDGGFGHLRRPRSCVMTGAGMSGAEYIDRIFHVCQEKGLQMVQERRPSRLKSQVGLNGAASNS